MSKSAFSRNNIVLLIIGAIAIAMAILSFVFSNYISSEIIRIAAENVRATTKIQASDLSTILVNKLESIGTNLQIISGSPPVLEKNEEDGRSIFDRAQESTADVTNFYMWLDENGKIVWLSNVNQTTFNQIYGQDLSYREYFTEIKGTEDRTFYSSAIESNDGIPRIYVSRPVIEQGIFKGAVVAGIRLDTLGKFLEGEISPGVQSSIGLLDRNGIILYSGNQTFIGKDFFGDEVQKILPLEIKDSFNSFLKRSLEGGSGVDDITVAGSTSSIAYQQVTAKNGEDVAVLYLVAPHQFASNVNSLVDQERNFSTTVVIVIGAIAVVIAVLVIRWNKTLESAVRSRTDELRIKTDELEQINTSLEQANEQLKNHGRMQKEFINIAAHELRTPTQAILGYSELLQTEQKDNDEMIKAVYRNALRLQRLASDILDVTRIESQTLKLDKETFRLDEAISTVLKDIKSQNHTSSKIRFVYTPTDIVVEADKNRIVQVLFNILSNAVKFTIEGTISVTAEKTDREVKVTVTDTGTGIDQDMILRLFTKFATKSQTGTGLGLFISKSIIEAHGGTISGKNNSDGRGATFWFTLPIDFSGSATS